MASDGPGIIGAFIVLVVLVSLLRLIVGNTGRGRPGRPQRARTTTEIALSVFAISNLITSPSAQLLDPVALGIGMAILIIGLGLHPRSGGSIAIVGLTAAVFDLALDQPDAVIPVGILALLLGTLFAQTRVLIRQR